MNIYNYTYQIGTTLPRTDSVEAATINEAYSELLNQLTVMAKKRKQRLKSLEVVDPNSEENMLFQDEGSTGRYKIGRKQEKFHGIIITDNLVVEDRNNQRSEVLQNFERTISERKEKLKDVEPIFISSCFHPQYSIAREALDFAILHSTPLYLSEPTNEYPFLYFLNYSRDEPCETGRVVAAIPFKLNSEPQISRCEGIIADILECEAENVVLTNFILLEEYKND